jgi:predicted enzyme related to lactoylglutathione lyase
MIQLCAAVLALAAEASITAPPAPIVFFNIAGPDPARQAAFYRDVFGRRAGRAASSAFRRQARLWAELPARIVSVR